MIILNWKKRENRKEEIRGLDEGWLELGQSEHLFGIFKKFIPKNFQVPNMETYNKGANSTERARNGTAH